MDMGARLDEAIAAGHLGGLHGVVVIRGGETLLEHYGTAADSTWGRPLGVVAFGPETLHDLRSVSKSVTALLYGIALGEGLVPGVGDSVLSGFPHLADLAADPERARITVAHALTMTLGIEWREEIPYDSPANAEIAMEMAEDRYRYVLSRPIVTPPGTAYAYCGGASALIGGLITAGAGRPVQDYARERLFGPLGIGFAWVTGEDGVASSASGLRLSPRGLARIGQLVQAGGEGLVPADWITEALTPRVTKPGGQRYGYQWHLGGTGWQAHGNGGQRLLLLPEHDTVVAITAGNYDDPGQESTPAYLLEHVVLPSL